MDKIINNPNAINLDELFEDLNPESLGLDSDISSFTNSCSLSTDQPLENMVYKSSNSMILFDIDQTPCEVPKKKRGRKPLRPNDPIRTKTEEKDKFWLRAFRSYVRKFVDSHWKDLCEEERLFWKFYFSANGKPGKKKRFLSYGKVYKSFLFESTFFKKRFKYWFSSEGDTVLERKYKPGTDEYFVYYNYCQTELFCYNEEKIASSLSQPCPDVEMQGYDELLHEDFDL